MPGSVCLGLWGILLPDTSASLCLSWAPCCPLRLRLLQRMDMHMVYSSILVFCFLTPSCPQGRESVSTPYCEADCKVHFLSFLFWMKNSFIALFCLHRPGKSHKTDRFLRISWKRHGAPSTGLGGNLQRTSRVSSDELCEESARAVEKE